MSAVTPEQIEEQRKKGWPDFHPEDFCHKCGGRNLHAWTAPEWAAIVGSHSGILCPQCFADLAPNSIWILTRWTEDKAEEVEFMADVLRSCTNLGEDAVRVARCVLDAKHLVGR